MKYKFLLTVMQTKRRSKILFLYQRKNATAMRALNRFLGEKVPIVVANFACHIWESNPSLSGREAKAIMAARAIKKPFARSKKKNV